MGVIAKEHGSDHFQKQKSQPLLAESYSLPPPLLVLAGKSDIHTFRVIRFFKNIIAPRATYSYFTGRLTVNLQWQIGPQAPLLMRIPRSSGRTCHLGTDFADCNTAFAGEEKED